MINHEALHLCAIAILTTLKCTKHFSDQKSSCNVMSHVVLFAYRSNSAEYLDKEHNYKNCAIEVMLLFQVILAMQ